VALRRAEEVECFGMRGKVNPSNNQSKVSTSMPYRPGIPRSGVLASMGSSRPETDTPQIIGSCKLDVMFTDLQLSFDRHFQSVTDE
jgi:hypothetical protein